MSSTETKPVDPLILAASNRVENWVQIELQKRQFSNRYTTTKEPGEPIEEYQSIPLGDYQVYKPAWAIVRPFGGNSSSIIRGTALMLTPETVEDGKQKLQFGQPRDGGYRNDSYFNDTYETTNPNTNYLSEYGTGGSYRPRPGLRNIQMTYEGSGYTTNISLQIKAYTRKQLNVLSTTYCNLQEGSVLVMFGYANMEKSLVESLVNLQDPLTKEDLAQDGLDSIESKVSRLSLGRAVAKVGRLSGFDINVSSEDSSFDLSTTYTTAGLMTTYQPQNDNEREEVNFEIINKVPVAAKTEKIDAKNSRLSAYRDFLKILRGYPESSLKYKSFVAIPTTRSLFEIGQNRVFDYIETVKFKRIEGESDGSGTGTEDDRRVENTPQPRNDLFPEVDTKANTAERVSKLYESEESDKSLSQDADVLFVNNLGAINGEITPLEDNLPDEMANEQGGEDDGQLVTSVRPNTEKNTASKKGNDTVNQMYMPWALCEWIINNGIEVQEGDLENKVILPRFSSPIPKHTNYTIPMVKRQTEEIVKVKKPNPNGGEDIEVEETIYKEVWEDDWVTGMTSNVSTTPASHKNYIRSVFFPKVDEEDNDFFFEGKGLVTMGEVKNESVRTETSFLSNFVSVSAKCPTQVFSNNPGICVLTNPNGIVSPLDTTVDESGEETPIEESGVFKMKDLAKGFSSFTSEKKDSIYIRNILVNAQWFYDKYIEATKEPGAEKSLKAMVDDMFEEISGCFNNTIAFETNVNEDSALRVFPKEVNQKVYSKTELETAKLDYRVIEYPKSSGRKYRIYDKIFPINNFGQDSVVRDVSYSMDLDASVAGHFFWNYGAGSTSTVTELKQSIAKKVKERDALTAVGEDTSKIQTEIDTLLTTDKENKADSRSYLKQYQLSATKSYAKLIPTNETSVPLNSETEVLRTKLTKVLTAADVLNDREELDPPPNAPKVPLQVEITLDGIAGIKMFDAVDLTYVPALYGDGHFKVVGITHSLEGTDWLTKLTLLYVESSTTFSEIESLDPEKARKERDKPNEST